MPPAAATTMLDPRRADLASFANAYAVGVQLREHSGVNQFIIRTGNPLQPVRVTNEQPANDQSTLAMIA